MTDTAPSLEPPGGEGAPPGGARSRVVAVAAAAGVGVLVLGAVVYLHAEHGQDRSAVPGPKPVTVVRAKERPFQPTKMYVGTLEPWLSASVGPQIVSAYVDTVLVRPGAEVKRGDVLATLDCRDASAENRAAAAAARAVAERQKAKAHEAARLATLLPGKLISPMEVEKSAAASASEAAELQAMKAELSRSGLSVNDCVLRAPFDGEVSARAMDPGGYVRPGSSVVSVVDRSTVRFTADVPELDFARIQVGTVVRISVASTGMDLTAAISRRAPAADPSTRTVRFEVDLADPDRTIPVGTTGEAKIDAGPPEPAIEIPLAAASVRGSKATFFVVEGGVARARTVVVKGEVSGRIFVDTSVAPGALVVTEGRALVGDGDRVSATEPP